MTNHAQDAQAFACQDALRAVMEAAISAGQSTSSTTRLSLLTALKAEVREHRERAERLLCDDRKGYLCAERLSHFQDCLIRAILGFAVERVYPSENRSSSERMSAVAVGGYGRGTLAPGSDIDLLFILPYKQTAWGESIVEYVLYFLWDLGFKVGHATRTVDETLRRAKADFTIRTAILETRLLWGDVDLYDELNHRFDQEIVSGSERDFVSAKLEERDQRLIKSGGSRYLVEPNVKEGKGGLRDLNTLFWISKYVYRVRERQLLVREGVFTRAEYNSFTKAEAFLWSVRCHLHFVTNRAEERLSFDVQREIAERLGYVERSGLRAVERFMKHYFLVAKSVGDLTRTICAQMEESKVKPRPSFNRFFSRMSGPRRRPLSGTDDFIAEHGRLVHVSDDVFDKNPVNLIGMFHLASRSNLALHPDLVAKARRSLALITGHVREDAQANRLFIDILCDKHSNAANLRRMNHVGVLGKFVPDFGKVVAMMQFNMYHHYTVDEHLIRSVGEFAALQTADIDEELPLSAKILPTLRDPKVLYVALFLHDIAKGRPEDHSVAGARIARKLCPRFGLSEQQTELVAWLIEEHLTMSMIAQSRDLADRRTILDFSSVVQSLEEMKLLLLLTVCDIRAVGPGVWNGWKGQLLRTLYYETEPYLTGGHSQVSRDVRVAAARQELIGALEDWTAQERDAYAAQHFPAYWLRVDLETKLRHAAFIRRMDQEQQRIATDVVPHAFEGVTELTVYAPDHPKLLCVIAGACAAVGANIVDAQIYTTTSGYALDSISLSRAFDDDIDELRRAERINEAIKDVSYGLAELPDLVVKNQGRDRRRKLKAFALSSDVAVTNELSDRFTVIEASGLDRPGLLYDLTQALGKLNLDISSAHIATFGERAVDVFYVTDLVGEKIVSKARQKTIRSHMLKAFNKTAGGAPAPLASAS